MTVSADCGCCSGRTETALSTANRPGLPALSFRVGTHGTFLDQMKARLSAADLPALAQGLRTRDSGDFSIGLLDCWAILADVLTFYQERIANEGYIRTATERLSVLELARLVGYELRPGVAASAYLAYTLNDGPEVQIAAGARVQSTPGPDETPQIFETAEDLRASADWNTLKPRRSQLPDITSDTIGTISVVHFTGATNNLKQGDVLLFNFSAEAPTIQTSVTRRIQSVQIVFKDASKGITEDRTDVTLAPMTSTSVQNALRATADRLQSPELQQLATLTRFTSSALVLAPRAQELAAQFQHDADAVAVLSAVIGRPIAFQAAAPERAVPTPAPTEAAPATRTAPARRGKGSRRTRPQDEVPAAAPTAGRTAAARVASTAAASLAVSSSSSSALPSIGLQNLLSVLRRAPTPQPINAARLVLNRQQVFNASSDVGPQVLRGFFPELVGNLYLAFATPQPAQEVFVFRQTALMFGNNAPKASIFLQPPAGTPPPTTLQDNGADWGAAPDEDPNVVFLDNGYPSVIPGDLLLIQSARLKAPDGSSQPIFLGTAAAAAVHARSAYRVSGPTTEVRFDAAWWNKSFDTIRDAVVYTKAERLTLAREPLTDPIGGSGDDATTIELDRVYPGLTPGRWIIVSGDQIVSDNVTIPGAERVMIAAVDQNGLLSSSATSSGSSSGSSAGGTAPAPPPDPHTVLTLAGEGLAFTYRRDTVQIFGNVVLATHGETRSEVLGAGDATASLQTFTIKKPPLTFVPAPTASGIASTLQVTVNDIIWRESPSLAFLGPSDRGYVVRVEDSGTTSVIFGTGARGARLPTGVENVKAVYRSGIGRAGNLKAGQLNLLQTRPLGVKDVTNPLPATGGADRDSRDQGRRNAPQTVTALDRLVSIADYATFARAFAGVGKATAERVIRNGRPRVHVTVSGQENAPITLDSLLVTSLKQALQNLGDPALPIELTVCPLTFLFISAGVHIGADRVWEPVVAAVRQALTDTFSFDARDVGQSVFLSEVISTIQNVDGVDYVDVDALSGVGQTDATADLTSVLGGLANTSLPVPPIVRGRDASGQSAVVYLNPNLSQLLVLREITP